MSESILSTELIALIAAYEKNENISQRLNLCCELARRMEMELAIHRLGEAGRTAREAMEGEAGKVLAGAVLNQQGNIIRPDFGVKK